MNLKRVMVGVGREDDRNDVNVVCAWNSKNILYIKL